MRSVKQETRVTLGGGMTEHLRKEIAPFYDLWMGEWFATSRSLWPGITELVQAEASDDLRL